MVCSIVMSGVTVRFESSVVLDGVIFSVNRGEVLGVLGPNGSGKTTLLRSIARAINPTSGEILVFGRPAWDYTEEEYSKVVSAMLPNWPGGFSMKTYEIVLMGCRNRSRNFWWEEEEELEVAKEALQLLGALDLFERDFDTLSSGEQRKVLIAKSLAQRTNIILLDEPVAYLDIKHKLEVMNVLRTLAELGKTVVVSLHELELASGYCDKLLVLNRGKIVAAGEPRSVISEDLLREVYGVEAEVKWDGDHNYPLIIPKTKKIPKEEILCLR
ncbi:MAG: ABC transporter ATP-binding protein [Candidatus Verstraetearchaeota archaeon]|nr:ABC transporter ATP-binding protein [Candidatus Verstraetearchaeota archaeon]